MKYKPVIMSIEIRQEEEVFKEVVTELEKNIVELIKEDYNEFDNDNVGLDEYLERVLETKELKDTINEIVKTKDMIIK